MTFEDYLRKTLPACRLAADKEEQDEALRQILESLEAGEPIIIMGKERTGKSTLVRVLRAHGYKVIEPDEMIRINLTKQIPFEDMITDFYRSIE
ncbi:hypothetical protein D3Z52_12850 [Clostridiaceae bacterium]|nr:hypothetical protein [Clostridiaceae bacterium]